jgi:ribosomal protein S18 acetylase RimI-like enzyme
MNQDEFDRFITHSVAGYAADNVAAGQWTEDEAMERSQAAFQKLLPDGLETVDAHLYSIEAEGLAIGWIWIALHERGGAPTAFVYDIQIDEEHRRQGHGRRAFLALEDEVNRLGLLGIGLHVFGHNTAAISLYRSLGYETTHLQMFKSVVGKSRDICPPMLRNVT